MCDDLTNADNEKFLKGVTRREFGAMAGAAGLAALLPAPANAKEVKGRDVTFATPHGTADGYFAAPSSGKHPAVLVWPDVMGIRPAFRQMGERLAQSGYAVLTVNPFYRSVKGQFLQPGESYADPAVRAKIGPWRALLTPEAVVSDAAAYIGWLDEQAEVDVKRGVGTTGYCMGGPFTMRTAAALPGRVKGGASFHGGGLATDKPDSPHLLVPKMKARFLVAVAENDDKRNPQEKELVRKAFADAGLPAEIEVYEGAMHGWCPPDSQVYNQVQAEKAWNRLLETFKTL
ncbi:dienelactone hydrolase family protein [Sphingomonas suaedae]|uniref:Dienelactone hydrolase family protein n=1 Tax=Sphingomonas suaedae TaxID=2599297 RepID=A0A518RK80_9SPHN|nr:dienelactone hydrolase family protein [Sphingomonas suaedae]QDX27857.1 dienelactone hydrolase family protein [Sphingomonas suaedae]